MKPAPFELHRPSSLDEALALVGAHGDDAKVLAGGQSLMPLMALRLVTPAHVVDITKVAALRDITVDGDRLVIGALTSHRMLGRDPLVGEHAPLLTRAIPLVGHEAIRNRGTIGGSLAHADPAAELPAVAVALGVTLIAQGLSGRREIPAAEFFDGLFTTSLRGDEILTAIAVPLRQEARTGNAIEEIARRRGDFAIAGAAVTIGADAAGQVTQASLCLFGVADHPVPIAVDAASVHDVEAVAHHAAADLDPPDSVQASGWYRRRVVPVVVARALRAALAEVAS